MQPSVKFLICVAVSLLLALVLLLGIEVHFAHSQDTSGFYVAPDGGVTQWDAQSGYSATPGGTSAWSPSGGYSVPTGGGYGSWSGPVQPVVPSEPQTVIVPDAPQQ